MREWPEVDDDGDLPVGIHRATIAEVLEHFATGTVRRRLVGQRLERVYRLAHCTGQVARFIVFGSFVTAKPDPGDVDIFLLMGDSFDSSREAGEAAIVFDHAAVQNVEGASVFWIRRLAAIGGEQEILEYWQIKRDGTRRGIVEVIGDDPQQPRTRSDQGAHQALPATGGETQASRDRSAELSVVSWRLFVRDRPDEPRCA